jgi:hypothetical protein
MENRYKPNSQLLLPLNVEKPSQKQITKLIKKILIRKKDLLSLWITSRNQEQMCLDLVCL